MKIERNICWRILYSLLAHKNRGLVVDGEHLVILDRKPRIIRVSEIAGLSRARLGLFSATLEVPLDNGDLAAFGGFRGAQAKRFADTLNDAWAAVLRKSAESHLDTIRRLVRSFDKLEQAHRFPAACVLQPLWQDSAVLVEVLPKSAHDQIFTPQEQRSIEIIAEFHRDPNHFREMVMRRFIDRELSEMSDLFNTIEAQSLTSEQRRAIVCDEDATLVLAGAGSGKTSVISAKAVYLIKRKIRRPEQILLMAYAKDAAKEMSGRIAKICDEKIAVATFHSLGYDIISEVEGARPLLAKHASDEKLLFGHIREILIELARSQRGIRKMLSRWFTEFFFPAKSEWDFSSPHEYYDYIEAYELRTLNGEKVRSFEELMIANWLCMNGISYEYEPEYEHELPEVKGKPYTPDFRLKQSGVYIEHFGVRRELDEKGGEVLTTAPFVDRQKYLKGMEWKRQVHAKCKTTLIETFSYENTEGRLLSSLEVKLAPYVAPKPASMGYILALLKESGEFDDFTKMLVTFLRHFKGSGQTIETCRGKASSGRELAFLAIFECVFEEYQKRLGSHIDFEDMISRATGYVRENRYRSPFRHLLVDEFQDISATRANLLMALKEQHPDTRVFAVGDDWQSIYRFAGSDISLMQNFGATFGGVLGRSGGIFCVAKLERTFRCVDQIAYPARRFVLRNPSQIEKNVIPAENSDAPAISIFWSASARHAERLEEALGRISNGFDGESASVLLVGRYNRLKPRNLDDINRRYSRLSVFFRTIHSSKGLEADHVIILGAEKGRHGLPSEMADDPLLSIVLSRQEQFEHAEERRVFYVALTRARKSVSIIARKDSPSSFVQEFLGDKKYGVSEYGLAQPRRYLCARCGGQMRLTKGKRYICEHWDNCDAILPACPACGIGLPVRVDANSTMSRCACGAAFHHCEQCADGWLVRRSGKYGPFFGCVNYPRCRGRRSK